MDAANLGQWVGLMLAPTLIIAAALSGPRSLRAVRRFMAKRGADDSPQPTAPPIEELAADLRRLLQRHHGLRNSTEVAMRVRKLQAIEAAITDCAVEAARALDVPCPARRDRAALATPELRRLLHALAAAGLVLAPLTGVFAADARP